MSEDAPEPEPSYLQLRSRILSLNPADLGLAPSDHAPHVWGIMVEMGYEVGTASLVALADGTTSLYYSTGGGLLGRGDFAPLAKASKNLVARAEDLLPNATITTEFPLPQAGQVRFILMAYSGNFAAEAPEKLLTSNKHPLSSAYQAAQDTLAQLRALAEKRRK